MPVEALVLKALLLAPDAAQRRPALLVGALGFVGRGEVLVLVAPRHEREDDGEQEDQGGEEEEFCKLEHRKITIQIYIRLRW